MTGAAILSSLGGISSGPAGFRKFRLDRISETRAILTGCLRLNIDKTGVARKFI